MTRDPQPAPGNLVLQDALQAIGWTGQDLADKLNAAQPEGQPRVQASTVWRWTSGRSQPPAAVYAFLDLVRRAQWTEHAALCQDLEGSAEAIEGRARPAKPKTAQDGPGRTGRPADV